jgi:uracil phosphoribosyltransferase
MTNHLTIVDHPLVQHKLTLMREKDTSTKSFRQLLREISLLLAYEVTRDLPMTTKRIETPLCPMDAPMIEGKKLALISILRAGNGLLDGILELIPAARVGFVGLYRDPETLQPVQYYFKVPTRARGPHLHRRRPDARHRQLLGRRGGPAQAPRARRHPLPLPARRARRRRSG